ncbi:hypothetical protein CUJ83_09395 [Methanocella sp. CWC-04]|uniref:DUF8166 domain-containing protein n=1 Tax=Methanooceanicella nereidis TaxID=2052831 RepID=A0AAP2W7M5_9EURY|nr:hypothetical protein [Methanocella sp. CWC-04]MCD1295211.1 hypothetical protein [Methanocella sp. CWC-04]
MKVGSVVQVKSFSDYVVKVPVDTDEGYIPVSKVTAGTYVSVSSDDGEIIGIVTDVLHSVKEDYLPFMAGDKQDIFIPYTSDYRNSYLLIKGIGNIQEGNASHSLVFAPRINDPVRIMETAEIRAFHTSGDGKPTFSYYRKLSTSMDPEIVTGAIDRVACAMPECLPLLKALKKHTENQK